MVAKSLVRFLSLESRAHESTFELTYAKDFACKTFQVSVNYDSLTACLELSAFAKLFPGYHIEYELLAKSNTWQHLIFEFLFTTT